MRYEIRKGQHVVDVRRTDEGAILSLWARPHDKATGADASDLLDAELGAPEFELLITAPDIAALLTRCAAHAEKILTEPQVEWRVVT